MRCPQCEAAMINGIFCHETGCPNTHARYDVETDSWIAQYTCSICGYQHDVGTPCDDGEEGWE